MWDSKPSLEEIVCEIAQDWENFDEIRKYSSDTRDVELYRAKENNIYRVKVTQKHPNETDESLCWETNNLDLAFSIYGISISQAYYEDISEIVEWSFEESVNYQEVKLDEKLLKKLKSDSGLYNIVLVRRGKYDWLYHYGIELGKLSYDRFSGKTKLSGTNPIFLKNPQISAYYSFMLHLLKDIIT
jgi:hypothetical protein